MKVLGSVTALGTGTKFTTSTAVWVSNTATSAADVTVRNKDDDGDVGSINVPAGSGVVIHLEPGQGLRGASTVKGTQVDASSGR